MASISTTLAVVKTLKFNELPLKHLTAITTKKWRGRGTMWYD